jgi:20S proteasome alpha/beta subunit
MFDAITAMTLGCSLLWLPFDANNSTHIIRIHESGVVETCSHFAAIGSGMYIAESSLFQREQSNEKSLGDMVYHIYEAMKLGSAAPGVGKNFSLHIVSPPTPPSEQVKMHWITEEYDKYMDRMFAKFGPKKTSGILYRPRFVKLNKFSPTGAQMDEEIKQ